MAKNFCRRSLSTLLAIVMVATTCCFANPAMIASAWSSDAPLETDGRPNSSASTSPAVLFLVPETIYLDPAGTTYTYFVDASPSGVPEANPAKTQGQIYFHTDVPVTNLKISRSDASSTYSSGTGKTTSLSTTFSNTGSARNGGVIEWKASYSMNSVSYESYAYTYVYRPSLDVIGQAFRVRTGAASATERMVKGSASVLTGFQAADSTYVGNRTWGGANDVPNPQTQALEAAGVKNWGSGCVDNADKYLTSATNGGIYYENLADSDSWIRTQDTGTVSTGAITVDRSRYTNLNQIPYLQAANYQYYNTWEYNGFARYACGITTDGSLTAAVTYTDYNVTDSFGGKSGTAESFYSATRIDCAISDSTAADFYLWNRIYTNGLYDGTAGRSYVQVYSAARLHVTLVDKSALRSAYRLASTLAVERTNSYVGFANFQTQLRTAGIVLGNPTATQEQIQQALTGLNSAYTTLKGQLAKVSAVYQAPSVIFYVPETIYLQPNDGRTFQYYIDRDNTDAGALIVDSAKTSGNIYFKCSDSTAKVTGLTVTSDIGFLSEPTIGAVKSNSNTLSTSTSGGVLSAQVSGGTTSQLTWTATYTTSGGSFSVKAYSTLYATRIGASSMIAASAQSGYNSNWHTQGNMMVTAWIAGIHSANYNQASPDSYSGTTSGSEGDGRGSYKGRLFEGVTVPVASEDNVDKCFEGGTGGSGYFAKDSSVDWTGGAGWFHVDTSRYTNLSQIPFLQFGLDDNYERTDSNNTKDNVGGLYYTRQGGSETEVGTWSNSGNGNSGARLFTGKKFDTSVSGTGNFWIQVRAWGQKKTEEVCDAKARAYLYVDQLSKATLRSRLNEEVGKRKATWYTAASWNTYSSIIKQAYNVLGNPAASSGDVSAAVDSVASAPSKLVRLTGSLSAKHYSDTVNNSTNRHNLLGTDDVVNYSFGDTVSVGPNNYPGYTYSGTFGAFDAKKWEAVDGVNAQGISSISVDAETNSITLTGTASDSFTRYAMGSHMASDEYYFVPCLPGTPYTFSFTGSGTDGTVYIYYIDADFNYVGRISKSGLGAQTLSATTPAKACYMQFRFGVGIGTKTYADIRLVGGIAESAQFIDVPNTVYHLYYTPNEYTVTYRPAGGTFNGTTTSTTDTVLFDDAYTVGKVGARGEKVQLAAPTRTGYTFAGWQCSGSDTVARHAEVLGAWKYDRDITYTAIWTANSYTVHFDGESATGGSMDDQTLYFDTEQTLSRNAFTRTGFHFNGWALIKSSTPVFADGEKVLNLVDPDESSITLYACWSVNTYAITVDPNGGTMATNSVVYTKNNAASQKNASPFTDSTTFQADYSSNVTLGNPTRTGYKFSGWVKSGNTPAYNYPVFGYPNGSGITTEFTKTVAPDGSYTNYKWEQGSTAVSTDTWHRISFDTYFVAAGETVNISGFIRINSGSQIGVNLYHGAVSNDYANGMAGFSYTDGQWKYFNISRTFAEPSSTAVFEICTGNGTGKSGTILDFDVKGITIRRGSPAVATIKMADNAVSLAAQWSPLPVTVRYDANGGTGSMTEMAVAYNETAALKKNTFEKSGCAFVGWSYTADGAVVFADRADVTGSSLNADPAQDGSTAVTLYAVWKSMEYTLHMDMNGADISLPDTAVVLDGEAVTLGEVTTAPVQFGGRYYSFLGWALSQSDADSGTVALGNKASFALKEAELDTLDIDRSGETPVIRLYAVWKSAEYTLHMNLNGAELTLPDTTVVLDGEAVTLGEVTTAPVQFGGKYYIFLGWALSQSDADSGTVALGNKASFALKEAELDTLDIDRSGETPVIRLYAVWKSAEYTLHVNLNGAEFTLPDTTVILNGEAVTLGEVTTDPVQFRGKYYTFLGWALSQSDADSGTVTLENMASFALKEADLDALDIDRSGETPVICLYAAWKSAEYTLHMDMNGADITLPDRTVVLDGGAVTLGEVSTDPVQFGGKYYSFLGWALSQSDADSGIVALENKASFALKEADLDTLDIDRSGETPVIRLYAVWFEEDPTAYLDIEGSKAVINSENGFIYGLKIGVTEWEIVDEYIQVVGKAHLEFEYVAYVGTGTIVRLVSDVTGEVLETYTIVIFGDLNGDGLVNNQDIVIAKSMNAQTTDSQISDAVAFAADLFEDGSVNNSDITIMKGMKSGIISLDQATREQISAS